VQIDILSYRQHAASLYTNQSVLAAQLNNKLWDRAAAGHECETRLEACMLS